MSRKLSEHFTEKEFLRTSHGTQTWVNASHRINAQNLCLEYLEPFRLAAGKPVIITSGYRNPIVNKKVGGSSFSAHQYGLAADFICPGLNWEKMVSIFKELYSKGDIPKWDQLIIYKSEQPDRLHLGLRSNSSSNRGLIQDSWGYRILEKI